MLRQCRLVLASLECWRRIRGARGRKNDKSYAKQAILFSSPYRRSRQVVVDDLTGLVIATSNEKVILCFRFKRNSVVRTKISRLGYPGPVYPWRTVYVKDLFDLTHEKFRLVLKTTMSWQLKPLLVLVSQPVAYPAFFNVRGRREFWFTGPRAAQSPESSNDIKNEYVPQIWIIRYEFKTI